ncbi:hypothetical protein CLM81_10170, partial [Streptomyces albidoflavus]
MQHAGGPPLPPYHQQATAGADWPQGTPPAQP